MKIKKVLIILFSVAFISCASNNFIYTVNGKTVTATVKG